MQNGANDPNYQKYLALQQVQYKADYKSDGLIRHQMPNGEVITINPKTGEFSNGLKYNISVGVNKPAPEPEKPKPIPPLPEPRGRKFR